MPLLPPFKKLGDFTDGPERTLLNALNTLVGAINALSQPSTVTTLQTSSYNAHVGENVRIKAGNTVTLPPSNVTNQAAEVAVFLETEGSLLVRAQGTRSSSGAFTPGLINGASSDTIVGIGMQIYRSDGNGGWFSTSASTSGTAHAEVQAIAAAGATGATGPAGKTGLGTSLFPILFGGDTSEEPASFLPSVAPSLPVIRPGSSLGLQVDSPGQPAIEITGAESGENIRYANIVTDTTSSGVVGVYAVTEIINTAAITAPAILSIAGLTVLSDGKEVTIYNAGVNPITLKQEDLSVPAASRFSLPLSTDLTLGIGDAAVVRNTASRWRCLNNTKGNVSVSGLTLIPLTMPQDAAEEPGTFLVGQPGIAGATGATGAQGASAFPVFPPDLVSEEPAPFVVGQAGSPGATGATGATGADGTGSTLLPLCLPSDAPEEPGAFLVGQPGSQGIQGPTGPAGSGGSGSGSPYDPLIFSGEAPEEPGTFLVGQPGATGATGPAGSGSPAIATVVAVDLGATPVQNGQFVISGLAGLIIGSPVMVQQAADDQLEIDSIVCSGIVETATTIRVFWHNSDDQPINGIINFQYFTASLVGTIGPTGAAAFPVFPPDLVSEEPVPFYVPGSNRTETLTLSPGQFLGLPIDAGASGPAIAITGAQGGENIRFNSWVIDSASAGNLTDYALALGTTGVSFQGTVVANLQGIQLAVGGNSGNPMFFTTANSSRVSLEHEAPGEATASRRLRVPGSISASLLANETALLLDDTSVSRRRVVAFARARSAVQANGGAISPAETLNFTDGTGTTATASVVAGVAAPQVDVNFASQAIVDAGVNTNQALNASLFGLRPGCSVFRTLTAVTNSTANNDSNQTTISANTMAVGSTWLAMGYLTVVRGATNTASNLTVSGLIAGATQTEVLAAPLFVGTNVRAGGLIMCMFTCLTTGAGGTGIMRIFGGGPWAAANAMLNTVELATASTVLAPFAVNTTINNNFGLRAVMSVAVPGLLTEWTQSGVIRII